MGRHFRKSVILILDGLGDLPVPELQGKTPLEAAHTPFMNHLAGHGLFGLVYPETPNRTPNTHTGCGTLMGVPPDAVRHLKRGPIEAFGAGHRLEPGEIAIRANFATLEQQAGGLRVIDRRAGRIRTGAQELAESLAVIDLGDRVSAKLLSTDQHRCVLVLSGPGLDPKVTDTDPGDRGMPGFVRPCAPDEPAAELTANKINRFLEFAHEKLIGHPLNRARVESGLLPANGVITRGAGSAISLENTVKDHGLSAALVAGCNTVIGLGKALGLEVLSAPGFTADVDTDLPGKMETALSALESHDVVYVHVKAPDILAHDQDPEGKRDFLERVDASLAVFESAGIAIALSADHSTNSNTGAHTADPVPALIYDPMAEPGRLKDEVNFGETACLAGSMPCQNGHDFLLRVLNLSETSEVNPD